MRSHGQLIALEAAIEQAIELIDLLHGCPDLEDDDPDREHDGREPLDFVAHQ